MLVVIPFPNSSVGWRNEMEKVFLLRKKKARGVRVRSGCARTRAEGAALPRTQVLWPEGSPVPGQGQRCHTWRWHGIERQQGGREIGGERVGFVFSSLCLFWG